MFGQVNYWRRNVDISPSTRLLQVAIHLLLTSVHSKRRILSAPPCT